MKLSRFAAVSIRVASAAIVQRRAISNPARDPIARWLRVGLTRPSLHQSMRTAFPAINADDNGISPESYQHKRRAKEAELHAQIIRPRLVQDFYYDRAVLSDEVVAFAAPRRCCPPVAGILGPSLEMPDAQSRSRASKSKPAVKRVVEVVASSQEAESETAASNAELLVPPRLNVRKLPSRSNSAYDI
jgi:hypothetical protein